MIGTTVSTSVPGGCKPLGIVMSTILWIMALIVLVPTISWSATYFVKTTGNDVNTGVSWALSKKTIQAAVNVASGTDEIWVATGTYQERVTHKSGVRLYGGFVGTEALLSERDYVANVTIIDANLLGIAVTVPAAAIASTAVDGFTIRNGRGTNGGGIKCDTAGLTVANCIVRNNAATSTGGGVYCKSSTFSLTNTSFISNSASSSGGGLYCESMSPTVSGCTFTSNSSSNGGGIYLYSASAAISGTAFTTNSASGAGGGIYVYSTSTPSVTGCSFAGNTAVGAGGGINAYSASPSITGNTLTGNTGSNGGGINITYVTGTVSGNTLSGNSADMGSGYGGAIYSYGNAPTISGNVVSGNRAYGGAGIYSSNNTPTIFNNTLSANIAADVGGGFYLTVLGVSKCVNNTVADNFSANGGGGIYCNASPSCNVTNNIVAFNASGIRIAGTAPTLTYNCVYGNDALPYTPIADPTGTNGNIAVDPGLANMTSGNLHIQPTSLCLDAGDGTVLGGGWLDMDGQARVQGAHVDIGADESDGTNWPGAPAAKVIYVASGVDGVGGGSDVNSGLSWLEPKLTIQAAIDTAVRGDEVWVMTGDAYVEKITLKKRVGVYGGFAGTETLRSERDPLSNITAIDSNLTGTVVTVPVGCFGGTAIDGFTIRNGEAKSATGNNGGGLYCVIASVTVANNTFRNNSATNGAGAYLDWSPSVLTGNAFRTGLASSKGGGIYSSNASPAISGNLFVTNTATEGAGVYLNQSSATITGCTFMTNAASSSGGGLCSRDSSSPSITGSTFTSNTASTGAGLYFYSVTPTITGNTFTTNAAASQGGGIYLYSASGTVANNILTGNSAETLSSGAGGGICAVYSSAIVYANTLSGNRAFTGAGIYFYGNSPFIYSNSLRANVATDVGGGIALQSTSSASCVNNTIADNFASNGGAGIYCINLTSTAVHNNIIAFNASGIRISGTAPTIKNNCVYGNDAYPYLGIASQTGLNGNIAVDPLLANVSGGNLHIQPGSPCINTGDDTVVQVGWLDMDAQGRISGAHVDIGADEADGTNWPSAPAIKIYRVKTNGNDVNSGLTWPLAKKTIQAAIDAASANDEIWVVTGTYLERITLKKRVSIYGGFAGAEASRAARNWTTNIASINANLLGTVVMVPVGCFGNTVLDGLTVRNGGILATPISGAGLYCYSASLNLVNCTFRNNQGINGAGAYFDYSPSVISSNSFQSCIATGAGGGIYAANAAPTFTSNLFTTNTAANGAGLHLNQCSPTVSSCTFTSNSATSSGGGLRSVGGSPTITGCTFTTNTATSGGGLITESGSPIISLDTVDSNTATNGGGIYLYSSTATVNNNTLTGNVANIDSGKGGGIYSYSSNATIYTNNIYGNRAYNGAGICCDYGVPMIYDNTPRANTATNWGGGMYFSGLGAAKVVNNTIADNFAANGGGGIYCNASATTDIHNNIVAFNASGIRTNGAAPIIKYNCVHGNDALPYTGSIVDQTGINGNIDLDPVLANMLGGNLHIQPGSPCKDAGDEAAVASILKDMDNQARIQGITVDIGADETNGTNWAGPPASKIIYVSTTGNDANSGLSWALAKRTVQAGISTAVQADEVWVAKGTYTELITLGRRVGLFGGFAGTENARDQRNWLVNLTVLDGNNAGTAVTVPQGAFATTALDGFTVKRGKGVAATTNNGGGMYCRIASVSTANNIFESNAATNGGAIFFDFSPSVLANNILRNNSVTSQGGAIYASNAPPTIGTSQFSNNGAVHGGGMYLDGSAAAVSICSFNGNHVSQNGGGLYLQSSSASIGSCAFSGNAASSGGGGLYIVSSSAASITGNAITSNGATHGGGLYLYSASGIVSNNTIVGNTANSVSGYGGGIYSYSASTILDTNILAQNRAYNGGGAYCQYSAPKLYNNRAYANTATNVAGGFGLDQVSGAIFVNNTSASNNAGGGGAGAYFKSPSTTTMTNNIVASNQSGVLLSGGALTVKNNCVYGNTAYQYSGLTNPTGTNGNISVDPMLVDVVSGNLHIQPTSPCVDAGSDDAVLTILMDMDGQDRIQGLRSDIGADESDGTTWPSAGDNLGIVKSTFADNDPMSAVALSVTAVFPDLGFIYAEKTDRASGIRIDTFDAYIEGELIGVVGTIQTDITSGERYVLPDAGWPKDTGGFLLLRPLGMNLRGVGGGSFGLQQGIFGAAGLNNIGLLITAWGRVSEIDGSLTPIWFKINDQSGNTAKVMLPSGVPVPVAMNDMVTVIGVSSCELDGGNLSRVIRARKVGDINRVFP